MSESAGQLGITIKPVWQDNTIVKMHIYSSWKAANSISMDELAWYSETVSIPFAEFDSLKISDSCGEIGFHLEEAEGPVVVMKEMRIITERAPQGSIKWEYTVYPRIVPEEYVRKPYYDFRNEEGGMNTSGLSIFILPRGETMNVSLKWDMSDMPDNASACSSLALEEGGKCLTREAMLFAFYMAGCMNRVEMDQFGIYWFTDPGINMKDVTGRLTALHDYMKDFFLTERPGFRIFLRRNPFNDGGGGTAVQGGFMSGVDANGISDKEYWFYVLSHEMVHNWPCAQDVPYGSATWFNEGCAEYYSTIIPYRLKQVHKEEACRRINYKADRYYLSEKRYMPDTTLAGMWWDDPSLQKIPYGRGFVYLANTDAELKRLGKGSIDDIICKCNAGHMMTEDKWVSFIKERLGEEGVEAFRNMKAGKLLIPDPECFGPDFKAVEYEGSDSKGNALTCYHWVIAD